ncbi:hypothetical protein WJX82_001964 [Trebouxia sp. C0006]
MDADVAPAKRLRFSPESKHAPQPKSNFDEQEQHRTNNAETPAALSPSRSSNSAGTCVQSDAASEQYCAAQTGMTAGSAKALRASAAPWTPAKIIPQSNPLQSSQAWQSLYGPSIFGSALAATDYETNSGPGMLFSSYTGQANAGGNFHRHSKPYVRPLEGSSMSNIQDVAFSQSEDDVKFTAPLPAGLFTPLKHSSRPVSAEHAHYDCCLGSSQQPEGSPAARMSQYSLFDQSQGRVSFATTFTPTSIFRRLKTSSPEDTEAHTQFKFGHFAHTQNIDPTGRAFPHVPSGLGHVIPVPQKRARPVQRGIHPAEINKRITSARESWQILDIVNTFGAEFDAVNVATALHRIAKQRPEDVARLVSSDGFKQLVMMVDIQADQCKPQQIANIMWAFGTLSFKPQQHLLDVLATQALSKLTGFNPQNLANFIWAYARMELQPPADVLQDFLAECELKLGQFAPQNISNMLWACATLGVSPGRKFLAAVTSVSLLQLHLFTPQAIKDTLWAMATIGYTPAKPFLQGAADLCLYLMSQFNPQNIANAIWAFAKFGFNPGREVLSAMATQAMQRLPQFNSQNMSNTLWAFASLNHHPGSMLLKVLQRELVHKLPHFTSQGIENVLWAFATLGHHPGEETLLAAAQHISSILPHFNQQNLALALWAFAKLGWRPHTGLLVDACRHALVSLHTINPQNLSNILWALATMEFVPLPALLEAAATRAEQVLADFTPQAVANLMWAFAALSHKPGSALLSGVTDDVVRRVNDYSAQHVAVTMWAFAKLDTTPRPELMQAVAGHMTQRIGQYSPQSLSNIMWAFATQEAHPGSATLDAVALFVCKSLQEFDGPALSNCLWAFAQLRHYPGASLLTAAALNICCSLDDFTPQAVSLTMIAYATFAHHDAALVQAVSAKVLHMPGVFDPQAIANTLWALALLDDLSPPVWNSLLVAYVQAERFNSGAVSPKQLCQIYQALLMLQLKPATMQLYVQPAALFQMCQQAFRQDVEGSRDSQHQCDVAHVLSILGVDHALNHITTDGLFCTDILVKGHHILIQVDGPHHWTTNTGQPIGPTLCRDKLLEARGWTVLNVPYFHWLQCQGQLGLQQAYIRQLLLGYVESINIM